MKIVVIGGTGLIGSKLVQTLTERGHQAVAAAPSTGVDTYQGTGLREVMADAAVVVDVSNSPSLDDSALDFFQTATANILAAEQETGVNQHVALSVVGTAELAEQSGYFKAKLSQEQLIAAGSVPYTIVHATQFFEFLPTLADSATVDGTVRLPSAYFQPMAAVDVARGVAGAALAEPVNGIVEIGGPQMVLLPDLIETALRARGDSREVVVDPAAQYWGIDIAERTLVPGAGATLFDTHYADWVLESAAVR